jgi:integrase
MLQQYLCHIAIDHGGESMPLKKKYLAEATTEFLAFRASHGDAANTIKNNGQVLRRALACWGDIKLTTITPSHIAQLFSSNDWAPSTRNLYRSNLNIFFDWARSCAYLPRDEDPLSSWKNVRVPEVDKDRVPVEQFSDLLDASRHPRDRMIVALGLFTFCRGSEIQTITIQDIDLDKYSLRIYRSKTKQEDHLPISSELASEIVRYQNWYRLNHGPLQGDWYLVPAKNPDIWEPDLTGTLRLSSRLPKVKPTQMETKPYRAVQRALRAIGYQVKGNGNHTLRRSGARAMADQLRVEGYDGALLRVASMLGHRDTKVTEKYIGWGLERSQRNSMIAGKPLFPSMKQGTRDNITHLFQHSR